MLRRHRGCHAHLTERESVRDNQCCSECLGREIGNGGTFVSHSVGSWIRKWSQAMSRMGLVPRTVLVRALARVTGEEPERIEALYAACRCGSCRLCVTATGGGGAYIVSSSAGPDVVLRGECCPPEKTAKLVRLIDLQGAGTENNAGRVFVGSFLRGHFANGVLKSAKRGTDELVRRRKIPKRVFVRPRPSRRQVRSTSGCFVCSSGGVQ